VRQCLGIDTRVDEHPDVAEHDSLGAGELGQRLPVQVGPGVERPSGCRSRCSSDRRCAPLISVKSYGEPISSSNDSTRLDRVRGM
jgi:hypothetical protein